MSLLKVLAVLMVVCVSGVAYDYDTADTRFEIEALSNNRLTVKAFEKNKSIFCQTLDTTLKTRLGNQECQLEKLSEGFSLSYHGKDHSSLTLLINQNGDLVIPKAEHTNYKAKKTWGFKTKGKLINRSSAAFYRAFTDVQEFHNYGTFKAFNGKYHGKYIFNKGIFHFGDEEDFAGIEAYLEYWLLIDQGAKPHYEEGIIDDYGVIIAERGLKIGNKTHRSHRLTDIGKELVLENSSIETHRNYNIAGPITGTANRIENNGFLSVDSLNSQHLSLKEWANTGDVYIRYGSDLLTQDLLDNKGIIFAGGNMSIGSRKKVENLGFVVADGAIKALIEEALEEASLKRIFGNAGFFSKKRKVIVDFFKHTDHLLNTITSHYTNGRFTHTTETGYIFQRRTTEKTKKEIEDQCPETPEILERAKEESSQKGHVFEAFRKNLKEKLKKLGLVHANRNALLAALAKGLKEAGLNQEDIESLFDDEEMDGFINALSAYDYLTSEAKTDVLQSTTLTGSLLGRLGVTASTYGLQAFNVIRQNPIELLIHLCDVVNMAATVNKNRYVLAASGVCNVGKLGAGAKNALDKANVFFSKKYGNSSLTSKSGQKEQKLPIRSEEPLLWGSWKDHKKVIIEGREYAQIGDRLYTKHAVDRMLPSGLGRSGGGDEGRSFPPAFVEKVIQQGNKTQVIREGQERTIHSSGTAEVITEQNGRIVVTVNPFKGEK